MVVSRTSYFEHLSFTFHARVRVKGNLQVNLQYKGLNQERFCGGPRNSRLAEHFLFRCHLFTESKCFPQLFRSMFEYRRREEWRKTWRESVGVLLGPPE